MNLNYFIQPEDLENFGPYEVAEIVSELSKARLQEQLVSVRVELDIESGDVRYYGTFRRTQQEYEDYLRSGGIWDYADPSYVVQMLIDSGWEDELGCSG